jgi:hypothetical protein
MLENIHKIEDLTSAARRKAKKLKQRLFIQQILKSIKMMLGNM